MLRFALVLAASLFVTDVASAQCTSCATNSTTVRIRRTPVRTVVARVVAVRPVATVVSVLVPRRPLVLIGGCANGSCSVPHKK